MRKIGAMAAALAASCALACGCAAGGTPADEWLAARMDDVDTLELFFADLDDVVTLYVTGAMAKSDYDAELEIVAMELNALEATRDEGEIRPGTHTEETKVGADGYEAMWTDARGLVDDLVEDATLDASPNRTTYLYVSWQDKIGADAEDFMTGYDAATAEGGE